MRRLAVIVALVVAWAAFGVAVNRVLNSRKTSLSTQRIAVAPTTERSAFPLPGTLYLSQGGHLYRLQAGKFTQLPLPTAAGSWTQPAAAGPGRLLVVARAAEFSDVYLIDASSGAVIRKLTSNVTPRPSHVELNAWTFWPHLAADGSTVISAYDGPKTGTSYEVHFAVWSGPLGARIDSRRWTTPTLYTGGDVAPVPDPSGGVVYASYALNAKSQIVSQVVRVGRAGAAPVTITSSADDCGEPALSPDGTRLAVICTADTQTARLQVIPLVGGVAAGAPRTLVPSCLCASPAWSPDGTSLAYLAPTDSTGHFQLWWIDKASSPVPPAPRAVTAHLDLDATSPPAWTSG